MSVAVIRQHGAMTILFTSKRWRRLSLLVLCHREVIQEFVSKSAIYIWVLKQLINTITF